MTEQQLQHQNDEQQADDSEQPDGLQDVQMGFLDHLAELRRRIVYCLIAVVAAFGICWLFKDAIYDFFQAPLMIAAPDEDLAELHQEDLTEVFFALLKSCLLASIFATAPFILYHVWKFVAPGLYPDEKRAVIPFILLGTIFFFLGGAFCYVIVIPFGYNFLFQFSEAYADPVLMIEAYFSLTTKLLLSFGLVFQLPVVTYFLSSIGVLTHEILLKQWRIAVVVAFLLGAVLTPPEVLTQALLAGPLIVLYFLSVLIAWVQTRRRERRKEE